MKKHLQVAAALIFENGKLLATKRGDSPFSYVAHKYEFAGGKIEAGERGEEAVARELKEELDLDVRVGALYACDTFEYPDFIITLWLYECEMLSAFHLKEHESYRWFSPKELNAEEWAPADAEIVNGIKRVFGE